MSEYANEKLLALDQLKAAVREYDNHTPLKYIGGQDVLEEVVEVEGQWDQDTKEERREAFLNFLCSVVETSGWPSDQFRSDLEEAIANKTTVRFADYIATELNGLHFEGNDDYVISREDINSVRFGVRPSDPEYDFGEIYTSWDDSQLGPGQEHYTYTVIDENPMTLYGTISLVKPGTHTDPYWQSREGEDLKIWNDIIDKPAFDTYLKRIDLTQEEYDALPEKDPYVVYVVSDSPVPPVQEYIKVQFVWPDNTPIEGLAFELYDHEGGMLENFTTALDTFEYTCFTIKDPDESYTLTYIGSPEYTTTIYPTADGFGVEVSQVQPQPTDGKAYFVVSDDGLTGTFFRSNETYENETVGTFKDIYGNEYQGTVYNEVEHDDGWQVPEAKRRAVTSIGISDNQVITPKRCYEMFNGCSALTSLNLSGFDTSSVASMSYMFAGCVSLEDINLSDFVTSNVTDMSGMFAGCKALTSLYADFDTSNVTNMNSMFYDCQALTSLDLSSFDVSNVTNMYSMFNSCTSLTSLDLSSFDVFNVTNMSAMFNGCSSLSWINARDWYDLYQTVDSSGMFTGCTSITGYDETQVTWEKARMYPNGYFVTP